MNAKEPRASAPRQTANPALHRRDVAVGGSGRLSQAVA